MKEVANTDESFDPVREPIKGRTIILGDWFTYRGKRYKVVNIGTDVYYDVNGSEVPTLMVYMDAAR